nr:glycosyltransferase [uncultured Acetatifactor sp.]
MNKQTGRRTDRTAERVESLWKAAAQGTRRREQKETGRQNMKETDYRQAYEQEHLKCADLAARIADLEAKNEELEWKLGRIKNNPLWKAARPVRNGMHWAIRQKDRIRNCGGPRGVIHKIGYKKREREAMKQFGTASFPAPEQAAVERGTVFPRMVKISILVPLWNNRREFQIEMLDSVMNQTYGNWELCLADGSDEAHSYIGEICREYAARADGRIVYRHLEKNGGIAGNTNACLEMATGEFIGLFDQDDILHPSVLYEYVKAINEQNADYLYCDETTFRSGNIDHMLTMHFKPDFAPDNLRANNYICHFSVFARTLLDGKELFRTRFDGSQDHDMILRLTDNAQKIVHVPRLMYYWRSHPGSTASNIEAKPYAIEAAKGAVAEHLRKHGYEHFKIESTRAFETIFRIRYQIIGTPKISVIIANKDHAEDLCRCVTSILEKSTYDNYEIIIVENNSGTKEIEEYYSRLLGFEYRQALEKCGKESEQTGDEDPVLRSGDGRISIAVYRGDFNYSAINNLGVKYASGEYVLLLNNDTEVITVNWMEELLMYAQREDVGAVGAKLYYGDKTIQHAGVVLGLGAHRTAGHSHYRQHRQNLGYMGRLCYAQDVSAVTGACLLVRKERYLSVGGLDKSLAVSLNDVDFCLKLREKGLLNVFTPFAELFHYESASRGLDDKGERAQRYNRESERFREKWKKVLEAGDPYYNPNFSLDRSDFSLKVQTS